ncbi:hypothetical protein Tco_0339425 [Tanacetum coccineum]
MLWGDLHTLFEPDEEDELWKNQHEYNVISWSFHKILRKFNYSDVKSASTPTDLEKPLVQDGDADDVDEHLYRSMIGSLMYLTASRPDIIYLKGKPSLGLWYSKDSPLELCDLFAMQETNCVPLSTTEAEYVAVASCCGQIDTEHNVADLLTKGFDAGRFQYLVSREECLFVPQSVGFHTTQQMVINSPCLIDNKELTTPEQTAPEFCDKHNMAAFLEKSTGSAGFHQVIDFLNRSHICYALTKKPAVSVSFIKQFWRSAATSTDDNGEVKIIATIDGHSMTITEASLRRHLKLDDHDGITSIPNSEIFEQLTLMGYHTKSDKLTFQKGDFSPQWRFLIHNILHCLSPKKTAWEQFSSNIATAVICLATNRKFNFSRMIFEHMVSNISSPHKFLMYPRFIQICLDMQRNQLQQHSRTYPVPSLSNKVFNNMKRPTKGYSGQEVALFPTMLDVTEPSTSPSRITSSPSHSPEPSSSHSPAPSTQHSPAYTTRLQPTPYPIPNTTIFNTTNPTLTWSRTPLSTPHTHTSIGVLEDDLRKTKKTYNSAFTKLILRVKKLESQIKTRKARRKARIVHSDDEDIEDDSSKQGRKLSDAEVQEKASTKTEPFIQEVTPTKVIQDQESSEKGSAEISTAGATKGTASEVPVVSTAEEDISTARKTVTYRRRSEEQRTRKDNGKAIMIESEPKQKSKKELEQERLS